MEKLKYYCSIFTATSRIEISLDQAGARNPLTLGTILSSPSEQRTPFLFSLSYMPPTEQSRRTLKTTFIYSQIFVSLLCDWEPSMGTPGEP